MVVLSPVQQTGGTCGVDASHKANSRLVLPSEDKTHNDRVIKSRHNTMPGGEKVVRAATTRQI